VELAVLGIIMIFCLTLLLRYGMSANQQQRVNMQAFRKAFARARSYSRTMTDGTVNPQARYSEDIDPGWTYVNSEPPLPSSLWRNVTYTVLEDKPILSASAGIPIVERSPVGAGANAVWSIDLYESMDYEQQDFLPRQEYEINGERYSFTTGGFDQRRLPARTQARSKENIEDWNGEGSFWEWVEKNIEDVGKNESVDIDGDGYEETVFEVETGDLLEVIDVSGNPVRIIDADKHSIELWHEYERVGQNNQLETVRDPYEITLSEEEIKSAFDKYINISRTYKEDALDYFDKGTTIDFGDIKITNWLNLVNLLDGKTGEINLIPAINDKGIKETGGLQAGHGKEMLVGNSAFENVYAYFRRRETAQEIITTDNLYAKEIFTRRFKVKDGYCDKNGKPASCGIYEVKSNENDEDKFSTKETREWTTPFK
jgi:hypothetical protein